HRFTIASDFKPFGPKPSADYSLWRYPSACAGRALPAAVSAWSPDFPRTHPFEFAPAAARPTGLRGIAGRDGGRKAQIWAKRTLRALKLRAKATQSEPPDVRLPLGGGDAHRVGGPRDLACLGRRPKRGADVVARTGAQ